MQLVRDPTKLKSLRLFRAIATGPTGSGNISVDAQCSQLFSGISHWPCFVFMEEVERECQPLLEETVQLLQAAYGEADRALGEFHMVAAKCHTAIQKGTHCEDPEEAASWVQEIMEARELAEKLAFNTFVGDEIKLALDTAHLKAELIMLCARRFNVVLQNFQHIADAELRSLDSSRKDWAEVINAEPQTVSETRKALAEVRKVRDAVKLAMPRLHLLEDLTRRTFQGKLLQNFVATLQTLEVDLKYCEAMLRKLSTFEVSLAETLEHWTFLEQSGSEMSEFEDIPRRPRTRHIDFSRLAQLR